MENQVLLRERPALTLPVGQLCTTVVSSLITSLCEFLCSLSHCSVPLPVPPFPPKQCSWVPTLALEAASAGPQRLQRNQGPWDPVFQCNLT